MQHRHDHFGCRTAFLLVDINRNPSPIITDRDGFIAVDENTHVRAIPGERLVNSVIDDFEHHVVQSGPIIRITNVHAWPFADGIKTLQNLDGTAVVIGSLCVVGHIPFMP